MKKLVSSSGIVVYEDGRKLFLCKTVATWTSTFLFVAGLLIVVLLVNGILQLFSESKDALKIAIVLLSLGLLISLLFIRVWGFRKKKLAQTFHQLQLLVVFDFDNNTLLDGRKQVLSFLSQTRLTRRMQIGSSSPELLIQWNGGSLSLVKGNPFSGGIGSIEKLLLSKGIKG